MIQPFSGGEVNYWTTNTPSLDFARMGQGVGYHAWKQQFPRRTDSEIRHMFAPNGVEREDNARASYERMQEKAVVGTFCGVIVMHDTEYVGFGWAADDTAVSVQQEASDTPRMWLAHLDLHPHFWRRGIGGTMVRLMLDSFGDSQQPTAYTFEENQSALRFFESIGFSKNPRTPRTKFGYFGETADPVQQWRLEAPSVAVVRAQLQQK